VTRRVQWQTRGTGALDGLTGSSVVTDRDVLPVTAALRDLQRASGLEVVAFGGCSFRRPGRAYSVRLSKPGQRPTSCLLVLREPHVATA
jgi:hypothetical protein